MKDKAEKTVGRPPIGITKKVSITLTEEDWKRIEEKCEGNYSRFFRMLFYSVT